jgi:hypothetical protein
VKNLLRKLLSIARHILSKLTDILSYIVLLPALWIVYPMGKAWHLGRLSAEHAMQEEYARALHARIQASLATEDPEATEPDPPSGVYL